MTLSRSKTMTAIGGDTKEERIKHAEVVGERLKQLLIDATTKNQAWLVRNLDIDRNVTFPSKDVIITVFDLATPAIDSESIVVRMNVNNEMPEDA